MPLHSSQDLQTRTRPRPHLALGLHVSQLGSTSVSDLTALRGSTSYAPCLVIHPSLAPGFALDWRVEAVSFCCLHLLFLKDTLARHAVWCISVSPISPVWLPPLAHRRSPGMPQSPAPASSDDVLSGCHVCQDKAAGIWREWTLEMGVCAGGGCACTPSLPWHTTSHWRGKVLALTSPQRQARCGHTLSAVQAGAPPPCGSEPAAAPHRKV